MRYPTAPEVHRRRRLIIAGLALAFVLIAFVAYSVQVRPAPTPPSTTEVAGTGTHELTSTVSPSPVAELVPLRPTSDPETFARLVADGLFEWNTAALPSRADHVERLVAVADPTGESSPGLVSDLDNYLPNQETWVDLAKYKTRQWLSLESVVTPTLWAEAETQAGDELLPGTTALTVRGIRHRSGLWENDPVTSKHDVAFTVFFVCAPSYDECHLLRLSMLNKPLA
jgi:hypothetical protein